jgi:MoxR-like ATPase
LATTTNAPQELRAIASPQDLLDIQALFKDMPLPETVLDSIVTLVRNARPETSSQKIVKDYVIWAPGPRATQSLALAVRAHALVNDRQVPTNEDIRSLARPILRHRMSLNAHAMADGITIEHIVDHLIEEFC